MDSDTLRGLKYLKDGTPLSFGRDKVVIQMPRSLIGNQTQDLCIWAASGIFPSPFEIQEAPEIMRDGRITYFITIPTGHGLDDTQIDSMVVAMEANYHQIMASL